MPYKLNPFTGKFDFYQSATGTITIGSTTITSGTNSLVLFDDSGKFGEAAGILYDKTSQITTIKAASGSDYGFFLVTDNAGAAAIAFGSGGGGFLNNDGVVTFNTSQLAMNVNIKGSTDANLFWADGGNNSITIGSQSNLAKVAIDGNTDVVQFLVQGHSTQTNFLSIWENSAGTDQITFGGTGAAVFNEAGNAVNFRVESDTNSNMLVVNGTSDSVLIGTATDMSSAFGINIQAAADIGQVTRLASSQSGNVWEVQNSSASVLAKMYPTGTINLISSAEGYFMAGGLNATRNAGMWSDNSGLALRFKVRQSNSSFFWYANNTDGAGTTNLLMQLKNSTTPNDGLLGINTSSVGASFDLTQGAVSSGVPVNLMRLVTPAHTGMTAATEVIAVDFNFSNTWTWAQDNLDTQRAMVIRYPTYGVGSARAIAKAVTLEITGGPISDGASLPITRPYDLRLISNDANNILLGMKPVNGQSAPVIELRTYDDASVLFQVKGDGNVNVPDDAYGSGWNGNNDVPTKNAVYDKIESISAPDWSSLTGTPPGVSTFSNDAGYITASSSNTLTNKTWNGVSIGATYGGTAINTSGSTGTPKIVSGTWSVVSPVADGTYTVGLGLSTNGTITVESGIITAIQQAS